MKRKHVVYGVVVLIVIGLGWLFFYSSPEENYDDFAKCLTEKGVKMYGATWCGSCNYQKKMFGSSKELLPYIECSIPDREQTQVCKDANIKGYPTWEFPDGSRVTGAQTIEALSFKSGCSLEGK